MVNEQELLSTPVGIDKGKVREMHACQLITGWFVVLIENGGEIGFGHSQWHFGKEGWK
jgi:hypothetical protein